MTYRQAVWDEPLLFEKRSEAATPPAERLVPRALARPSLDLPTLREWEVVRHFTRLSEMSFGIDSGFYPLGSCTMKYNPKLNEELAALPAVTRAHPYQDPSSVQNLKPSPVASASVRMTGTPPRAAGAWLPSSAQIGRAHV